MKAPHANTYAQLARCPLQTDIQHRLKYNVEEIDCFLRVSSVSANSRCSIHGRSNPSEPKCFKVACVKNTFPGLNLSSVKRPIHEHRND